MPSSRAIGAETQPGEHLRSVAILGGGMAGWSAAAALARRLTGPLQCQIRLVDPPSAAPVDPLALSTLPTAGEFHDLLRLDEDALVLGARGSFKLGTRFVGWSGEAGGYFEPFGAFGASLDGAAFHHFVARLRTLGQPAVLQDYSLGAVAAQLGRFRRPVEDSRSVLSTLSYALHLDAGRYVAMLRALAETLGVQRLAAEVDQVVPDGDGGLRALVLSSGERIEADLFIDCSGRLIGEALAEPFEDWSGWSPFDSRLEVIRAAAEAPAPYTTLTAQGDGWRVHTPLQGAAGEAQIYSRAATSDDAAAARLGAGEAEPRLVRLRYGRRARAWVGNCVAIGEAAGLPGP
ncbi:MAG: tryptophan 7-halogenase, partial [Phenylobacterium sp.]